jgi:hypothetical protein
MIDGIKLEHAACRYGTWYMPSTKYRPSYQAGMVRTLFPWQLGCAPPSIMLCFRTPLPTILKLAFT